MTVSSMPANSVEKHQYVNIDRYRRTIKPTFENNKLKLSKRIDGITWSSLILQCFSSFLIIHVYHGNHFIIHVNHVYQMLITKEEKNEHPLVYLLIFNEKFVLHEKKILHNLKTKVWIKDQIFVKILPLTKTKILMKNLNFTINLFLTKTHLSAKLNFQRKLISNKNVITPKRTIKQATI